MFGHYLASALRNFRRNPLSTAIKLLALALGLACLLTAHLIGDYFRQADSQWPTADRTYVVIQESREAGGEWRGYFESSSFQVADYLRLDFPELERIARMSTGMAVWRPGTDRYMAAIPVEEAFLEIFEPEIVAGEGELNRPRTVIISEAGARYLFGDDDAVGRVVSTERGVDLTVTGVYRGFPAASHLGAAGLSLEALPSFDVWNADFLRSFPDAERWWEQNDFANYGFMTYVVLPADGSLTARQLNRSLEDFAARRVPPGPLEVRFRAVPMTDLMELRFNSRIGMPDGLSFTTALYLLGLLALGVGCINFASLAVAETAARAREIGLLKTVGAARRQVAAMALSEGLLLAGAALVLTLPLTGMIARAIMDRVYFPVSLPGLSRWDYWLGAVSIAALTALAAAAYPAFGLARLRPMAAIRLNVFRGGSGAVRTLLIGAQFVAASVLVVTVLVMLMQSAFLRNVALPPGRDPIVSIYLQAGAEEDGRDLLETVRTQLMADSAVTGVTFRAQAPFTNPNAQSTEFAQSLDSGARRVPGEARSIYYEYFETMGVGLLAGRTFSRDMPDERSVIINEQMARSLGYTPEQAIGQTLYRVGLIGLPGSTSDGPSEEHTIVGVVEREPLELLASGSTNYVYFHSVIAGNAIVRLAESDVKAGLARIREVWRRFEGGAGTMPPEFLENRFNYSYRAYTLITAVFFVLSAIAIAIAAMGLFGMASFVVQRRVREIGVRKTLGASSPRVLALMLWDFSKPVIVANLVAWPFAFVAARAYLNLFVTRIDLTLWPFLGALGVSLLIAWIAVGAHVLRAAGVKPALVLRAE